MRSATGPDPAMQDLQRNLRSGRHVPGTFYSADEIYRLEKERIFLRDWLCIGRVEELANPGDYTTLRIADEPLIVTRDAGGRLNAFANVCRHRGVEVAQGSGNTKEFSCPYHGWLYDLTGRLVGAPYMKEASGFDIRSCRLEPIKLDTWQGWIFINFDPNSAPLDRFVADFAADFGFLACDELRLATRLTFEFDCNWKLAVENAMDNYHINVLHAETLGIGAQVQNLALDLKPHGGYCTFFDFAPRGGGQLWFGEKMPSLADRAITFSGAGFLAPNFQIFVYADNVEVLTYWPISVDRCRFYVNVLFPPKFFDLPQFGARIEEYRSRITQALEEDRSMVASLQSAMSARNFRPGPMARVESNIHHLIGHYVDRLAASAPS